MAYSTPSQLLVSSSIISTNFSFNPLSDVPKTGLTSDYRSKRSSSSRLISTRILASRRSSSSSSSSSSSADHHDQYHHMSGSRLVDEDMIVLRKRIHEMKMVERNYEPPSHWMDWEKKYYTSYDSLICQVMGFLQSQLMNTRPSLALGMVLLVLLSVPTSSVAVFFHLMGLARELFIN